MTVSTVAPAPEIDAPDTAVAVPARHPAGAAAFSGALSDAFAAAGAQLERADVAERAFAAGRGGLQEMVIERAQADIAVSIASAVASRTAQSLTTILGMQI